MPSKAIAVGLLFQSVADILKETPDFTAGFNDLMKGLAGLGLHQTIIKSMKEQGLNPESPIENTPRKAEEKK